MRGLSSALPSLPRRLRHGSRGTLLLALHATALLLLALWLTHRRATSRSGRVLQAVQPPDPPAWLASATGNWSYPLPAAQLDKGLIYEGDPAAASRLALKLLADEAISLVFLGGSLTMGHGASQFGRTDWPSLVGRWLRRAFPAAAHNLRNSAIPASPSEYISFCLQHYLPPEPDLIVLDYTVNNGRWPWEHVHPRTMERLLRRLARLPSRPVILSLQMHTFHQHQTNGTWHQSGEERMGTLLQYYEMPWLSFRSLVYKPTVAGAPGFKAKEWLNQDLVHPNDRGQEYVAQLVVRFLQRILLKEQQAQQLRRCGGGSSSSGDGGGAQIPPAGQQRGLGASFEPDAGAADEGEAADPSSSAAAEPEAGTAAAGEVLLPRVTPLPPPMLAGAEGIEAETCLHNARFREAVVPGSIKVFEWEDGVGQPGHVEDRLLTWQAGAEVALEINTDVRPREVPGEAPPPSNSTHVAMFVWFTHSHHWVGMAEVRCSGGCKCERQLLKPLLKTFSSQDHLHMFIVTRSPSCRITLRTLNETQSTGHLFRFRGAVVSSVAAAQEALPVEFLWGEQLEHLPPQVLPNLNDR